MSITFGDFPEDPNHPLSDEMNLYGIVKAYCYRMDRKAEEE